MKYCITALTLLFCTVHSNAETTIKDGVFTQAQVAVGKASYDKNCKACHLPEFYEQQLLVWQQAPLIEFYDLISGTMPQNAPGSLPLQEYTDALAYILAQLGYPAGEKELSHEDGSMAEVVIVVD